ncbi:MSMEG_1061 family FMN-dependent PPOX-type flavoprotein [Roseococcus sp. SYP-B2431]|uniref:MSMEG_1061 family FMN-dependent PPOX-type flavoprotein n=1 Tax=Roseococcus sp. SYP-B2431 TaxID=2496640 RepID=UPI0013F42C55|nr:MSMEG_1061 family FMN-dependent PPOX-type flavoprotein [Roseococcus sp. SYP-B2431]
MDTHAPLGDAAVADRHAVTTLEALEAIYGHASELAANKSTDRLDPVTLAFIAASPFVLLGTQGRKGNHITPRGDAPGFVVALDEKRLAVPDRKGNNRLDGYRDILEDNRVSLLFLVPGMGETMRVHGTATISTDPGLRARCMAQEKVPATVLIVEVREIFMQCAKAIMRSDLWDGRKKAPGVPSMGALLLAHKKNGMDPAAYDAAAEERLRANMY